MLWSVLGPFLVRPWVVLGPFLSTMKENVNASATGNVKVELMPSDQITDVIFTKLNRLEEMINKIVTDQIVMKTTTDEDIKEAVSAALMNHHHLFASKLGDSSIDQIANDVLHGLKQQ